MAENKNKTDLLHDQMPEVLNTKHNSNWKALIEAVGQEDQFVADLIESVRSQFFTKTANRPYLDRLGANVKVDRPRFIGMDDPTFRRYIPVLAYQPKQVKLIIDTLLDLFFFKESTTAFIETEAFEPFNLDDEWELEYLVDNLKTERIEFNATAFVDISNASANEIAGVINRQAKESFAIVFDNSVTKRKTIRLFTNTFGSKGSIEITGGRANTALRFDGFIDDAGNGVNTEWTVTKIGDTTTFQFTGGNNPGIEFLTDGDIFISDIPGNKGSFTISDVVISENKFSFINLFSTVGVFTQTSDRDTNFIRPFKSVVYTRSRRALSWETAPGKITIEMPTSPPVVRRTLGGSAHVNGLFDNSINRVSDTSLELEDASNWPNSGTILLQTKNNIKTKIETISESTTTDYETNSRIQGFDQKYTYTGKSGNILTGISPNLPLLADVNESNITTIARNTSNIITVNTATDHGFSTGEAVIIADSVPGIGPPNIEMLVSANGTWNITEIVNSTQFKAFSFGDEGTATGGTSRVERVGMANAGSLVILYTAVGREDTGITGPYIWDTSASFVLSSKTGTIAEEISAGQVKKILPLNTNNIPAAAGEVIFDFGTSNQEGPIRYLFKPSDNTIALDPAYIFQNDHELNSQITMINTRGAHVLSGSGTEFAPYITDTAIAREILQELILDVKSVGIFVEFLIRFPEQLYATLDVYRSGIDPG